MAEQTSSNELRVMASVLRRRAWVIVACAVLLPLVTLGLSLLQEKRYNASALLLFRDPAFDQQLFGSTLLPRTRDTDREAATNVRLLSVNEVAERTAASAEVQAARPRITGSEIADKIVVRPQGQADIASVTVSDGDPRVAALLANVVGREFIEFRRSADRAAIEAAQRTVAQQLEDLQDSGEGSAERRESLERRAEELGVLASLQTGNAELVQRAVVPDSPSSPRVARNVAVAFVLGLLLGLVLAFLIERFDRRFRDPGEVEEAFERPLLAMIPEGRRTGHHAYPVSSASLEPFRILRANLRYFNLDRRVSSLLVTSAGVGDGKSLIAANLAIAAAAAGDRVLLLDADLRRSSLAETVGADANRPGLSMAISSDLTLHEAVESLPLGTLLLHASDDAAIDVLVAGPRAPNPTDLLESDHMAELLRIAEESYDLVIVDTPPTTVVPDAVPLIKLVSGVIVVCRLGHTERDAARQLREQLELLKAPTLGAVVNSVKPDGSYHYAPEDTDTRREASRRRTTPLAKS